MKNRNPNYYVSSNSSVGCYSFLESNLTGITNAVLLLGDSQSIKQQLIATCADLFLEQQQEFESIHSCNDPNALDGIIIREKGWGIFNMGLGDIEKFSIIKDLRILSLDTLNSPQLSEQRSILNNLSEHIDHAFEIAYSHFSNAISVHDEWEQIYISHMHFEKADQFMSDVVKELFSNDVSNHSEDTGLIVHRFFGSSSYLGSSDFVTTLITPIKNRYYIKGRPGSGKSTMLKKIVDYAAKRNLTAEVYHCAFDPKSLDMVIVPELDFCIFDSTAPHEYYPSSPEETIIDMYEELIDKNTDLFYESQLKEIQERYHQFVQKGISQLAIAKNLNDAKECIYTAYRKEEEYNKLKKQLNELCLSICQ